MSTLKTLSGHIASIVNKIRASTRKFFFLGKDNHRAATLPDAGRGRDANARRMRIQDLLFRIYRGAGYDHLAARESHDIGQSPHDSGHSGREMGCTGEG